MIDHISINQFITLTVAEKMSAKLTENYLKKRAEQGSRAKFEAAMAQVPDVDSEPYDQL